MMPRTPSSFVLSAALILCVWGGATADESFSWGITDATVRFAGHDWFLKNSTAVPLQPGPCFWNPTYAKSDAAGLHLSVDKAPFGAWMSSEVMLDESLGYGRYELEVRNALGSHDPNIVFGAFIWDETNGAHFNGEIDIIEASRFGDPYNPFNAQQVIAPWNVEGRINRFALPDGTPYAILSVDWTESDIVFRVGCPETGYATSWSPADKSIIPKPTGFERLHLNAWQNFGAGPWYGAPVTFDVTSFSFLPSTGTSVVVLPQNVSAPLPAPSEGPFNASAPSPALPPAPVDASNTTAPLAGLPIAPPPYRIAPASPPRLVASNPSAQPPPPGVPSPSSAPRPPPASLSNIVPSLTTLVGSAACISPALGAVGAIVGLLMLM